MHVSRPLIILVKEYNWDTDNYYYSNYQKGKCMKKYTLEEVEELRKNHIVAII